MTDDEKRQWIADFYECPPGSVVQGEIDKLTSLIARIEADVRAAILADAGATVVLQPIPLGAESFEVSGREDEIRAAYATMASVVDLDLGEANVDYVDLIHFGDRGQRIVADAIVERLR